LGGKGAPFPYIKDPPKGRRRIFIYKNVHAFREKYSLMSNKIWY
jgi:hypothetical protein